jgi:hypothetical protein
MDRVSGKGGRKGKAKGKLRRKKKKKREGFSGLTGTLLTA